MDHCSDLDDSFLVQHLQHLLAGVRDIACELLGTELGLTDVRDELVDVDGCVDILLDHALGDENCVLVVVSVPWDKADKDVSSEGQITSIGGRTVSNDRTFLYDLSV